MDLKLYFFLNDKFNNFEVVLTLRITITFARLTILKLH